METRIPTHALALFLLSVLSGCAAASNGSLGTRPDDRRPPGTDPPPVEGECVNDSDCAEGLVCRAFDGIRYCVEPEATRPPTPPGDGTFCGECPAPGECREGVCIQPGDGVWCEFDPECGEGNLCIAGRCTPDPRVPTTCADTSECPGALMCSMDGTCVCSGTADCPIGLICSPEGACVPDDPDGCVADDECPAGMLCDGGRCITDTACGVVHPDLEGTWDLDTVLRLREALPGWLGGFLDAVAGPFHFIAGHTMSLDLGLPSLIEDLVAAALRTWADANLPAWARSLLGAIADMNDILSTWLVKERMDLMGTTVRDAYTGTHEWLEVTFEYRGMLVTGRPEDIIDWRFTPSPFDAQAVCGTFNIERHDVNVSIGAIIAWAVNAVVEEATDGRYATLEGALGGLTSGFCAEAGDVAEGAVDFIGVGSLVESWCNSELGALTDDLTRAVDDARIGLDLMTLKGHAPIVNERLMTPGVWEGTLTGGDFTGDFTATR